MEMIGKRLLEHVQSGTLANQHSSDRTLIGLEDYSRNEVMQCAHRLYEEGLLDATKMDMGEGEVPTYRFHGLTEKGMKELERLRSLN